MANGIGDLPLEAKFPGKPFFNGQAEVMGSGGVWPVGLVVEMVSVIGVVEESNFCWRLPFSVIKYISPPE